MPPARKRPPGTGATTTSLHGLSLSLWVRPTRRAGMQACRLRQMTTTSLHGSSSFVDLKKRRKKPTPSRNCKRGGGLSLLLWVQTEADDDGEPRRRSLTCKKGGKKPTLSRNCKRGDGFMLEGRKLKPTPACSCMQGGRLLSSCVVLSLSVISNVS